MADEVLSLTENKKVLPWYDRSIFEGNGSVGPDRGGFKGVCDTERWGCRVKMAQEPNEAFGLLMGKSYEDPEKVVYRCLPAYKSMLVA